MHFLILVFVMVRQVFCNPVSAFPVISCSNSGHKGETGKPRKSQLLVPLRSSSNTCSALQQQFIPVMPVIPVCNSFINLQNQLQRYHHPPRSTPFSEVWVPDSWELFFKLLSFNISNLFPLFHHFWGWKLHLIVIMQNSHC